MKRWFMIPVLVLALLMCACSNGTTTPAATEAPVATEAPTEAPVATEPPADAQEPAVSDEPATGEGEAEPAGEASDKVIEGPYIVTTCGQSPGAVTIKLAASQAGVEATNIDDLTVETLDTAAYKTLIVTSGTSMKGMGAAGTDVDAEIERCVAVMQAAKAAGMTVVGAHVEGMARRTDSSDQASIDAVLANCDVIMIIADSDSDGLFTNYAAETGKPLLVVEKALELGSLM